VRPLQRFTFAFGLTLAVLGGLLAAPWALRLYRDWWDYAFDRRDHFVETFAPSRTGSD
jgi:hypothetical protein